MNKKELIDSMIKSGALKTKAIIEAFEKVPREEFCIDEFKKNAYEDTALAILAGQTISQPSTVAIMTEMLEPVKGNNVLEIGTGSGYQAAILAELVKPGIVYSIEIVPEMVSFARENLKRAGIENVRVYEGDGTLGLPEHAPYDRIIVTAGGTEPPKPLKEQLRIGGRMIIPLGRSLYNLEMVIMKKKLENHFETEKVGYFLFVPLKGEHGFKN